MKNEKQIVVNSGIGFSNLLALIFIVLKLTKVISWSWWLITLPIWGPIAIVLGLIAIVLGLIVVIKLFWLIFNHILKIGK